MASPNADWDDITTTTLHNRRKKLADNALNNNALLAVLNGKGKVNYVDGGESIVEEIEFDNNNTYKRYQSYEQLDITPSQPFSAGEFSHKQAAVAISISGREMLQNSGETRQLNLLEKRIGNAEKAMMNGISGDIYSDGTADGAKQIGGLQHLVPDDPTSGTVGNINRATYAFWRTVKYSGVTDGGGAVSASNILSYMNNLYVQLIRGTDKPDLIVADNNYYTFLLEALQARGYVEINKQVADIGFENVKYRGATVVLDGGYGGSAPADHMYFLNTDYIYWRPHKDRNMAPLNPNRFSTNQDAMIKLIGFMGNMTISCGFTHGVLIA